MSPAGDALTLPGIKTNPFGPFAIGPAAAIAILFAGFPGRSLADFPVIPDYRAGDIATNDIATPIELVVIDAQRTETMRRTEAQRVQPFFRLNILAREEAEAALHLGFASARSNFLEAVDIAFNKRKLQAQGLASQRFGRLVSALQKQQKNFPLTTNLARLWASGDSGVAVEADLAARLRECMSQTIRPDTLPAGEKLTTPQVRLITVPAAGVDFNLAAAFKSAKPFVRSNFVTVSKARQEVQKPLGPEDKPLGKFLAGFVRANCTFDEELTRQARAKRIESLWAADRYEAGQSIVKSGQVIDARCLLALDELRTRTAAAQARSESAAAQQETEAVSRQLENQIARTHAARHQIHWLLAGLGGAVVAGLTLWWLGRRARQAVSTGLISTRSEVMEGAAWSRAVRPGLVPHLVRWLRAVLIQRLLFQRTRLLTTQQRAEMEIAQLEERLIRLHTPLHERLQAYEQRIAGLERDLATRNEENRELIKAAIASTRKKLEAERAGQPLAWN